MEEDLRRGDGFAYYQLSNVPPASLQSRLKAWVEEQPAPAPTEMPVRWQQLSVVFCEPMRQPHLTVHSVLQFRDGKRLSACIPEPQAQTLFEYLLFVEYNSQFQQLNIYGSMSQPRYHRHISECFFLSIGDIYEDVLIYDLSEQRSELLPVLRSLESDANLDTSVAYSLEDCVLATDRLCKDILHLNVKPEERLLSDMSHALSNRSNEPLGQRWVELIAAMHAPFREALLQYRRDLLKYRLNMGYVFEAHRFFFANTWFPGLLTFCANTAAQMVCFAGSVSAISAELADPVTGHVLHERHEAVRAWHRKHTPDTPYPGVLFSGPAQFLPQGIIGGLPQDGKNILFTHHELEAYLSNYLELELTETVGRLQQETGAAFARPIWNKVERRGHRYRLSHRRAVQQELEARARGKTKVSTEDIAEALAYRENFQYVFDDDGEDFDAKMLEEYVLPFVANMLDGEFLDHPEWQQEPLLHRRYTAVELEDSDEQLPHSYSALLRYAQEHWPPCAVRIVASCEGKHHLKYEMRLKMAALIRKFGHSEAAGCHLWTVLFSETEVAQHAKVPFLETEQGQVIRDDYHYNRTEKLGIGCESMRAVSLCPYATSPLVDIEECQQQCTAELSRKTAFTLKYPLHSPVEYKSLYQKYGRRSKNTPLV